MKIEVPLKLLKAFTAPRGSLRTRCFKGGRGSGKSQGVAIMSLAWGMCEPLRILCARQFQNSIAESFYSELKNAIYRYKQFENFYEVKNNYIRGKNGTYYFFKGLQHNIGSIKSISGVDIAILEEAEDISEEAWVALEPTIRKPKSEIWAIWNPRMEGSPVDKRFVQKTPPKSILVELNYNDNPFFPEVLETKRAFDEQTLDGGTYAHIWLGDYLRNSATQVLANKWKIKEFSDIELKDLFDFPYFGADFGFAEDPSTLIKCYVSKDKKILYIHKEAWGLHVEIEEMPKFYDKISESRQFIIRADAARPETISHIKNKGFRIEAAPKWQGSVEDGIAVLRAFDTIFVNPNCLKTIEECRLYSYKVDRLTGDILPVVVDKFNHCIDAIRYALAPLIKRRSKNWFDY